MVASPSREIIQHKSLGEKQLNQPRFSKFSFYGSPMTSYMATGVLL